MIKICGVSLSQLPERRELMFLLDEPLYLAWRERHKSIRDEKAARASLAGILLLQMQGYRDNLLYDRNGRPYFEYIDVDFNITHTEQAVFCAIETREADECTVLTGLEGTLPFPSLEAPEGDRKRLFEGQLRVGLDSEDIQRISSVRICPMADRWFSENEYDFFLKAPTDMTFLRIWTRKEALIKWTGEGLRSLRLADTVLAPSVYGVRFYEYAVGSTLLTLCCHSDATPPSTVHMFSNSELFDFGVSLT